jgi:hypothetical protein
MVIFFTMQPKSVVFLLFLYVRMPSRAYIHVVQIFNLYIYIAKVNYGDVLCIVRVRSLNKDT